MKRQFILVSILLSAFTSIFIQCSSSTDLLDEEEMLIIEYVNQQSIEYTQHTSGFYYAILDSGTVEEPTSNSTVIVTYDMYDLDDNLIEQISDPDPLTIEMSRLFDGIVTGLRFIGRGGDISLILPSSLASGEQGDARLAPNMALKVDMKLIEHYVDITDYHQRIIQNYLTENGLPDTLLAGNSYYVIENPGFLLSITDSSMITMNYTGYFLDGTLFDDRYATTDTSILLSNSFIGWQEVLTNFSLNGSGSMFLPSESAYGSDGSDLVPPDTPVAFDFKINAVN